MKGSWKLRPKRALNRKEAWACFSANIALAGSGSLAAGRPVGYAQMAGAFLAMIMTFVTAIPMYRWVASGGFAAAQASPDLEPLLELWPHVRWPLASIGLYLFCILWAMTTSIAILANASKDGVPPKIT
jgi:hypothetical protein